MNETILLGGLPEPLVGDDHALAALPESEVVLPQVQPLGADAGVTTLVSSADSLDASPLRAQASAPPNRFTDVISGQFDADEELEDVVLAKRVLAPQAESPKLHKVDFGGPHLSE
jgi:23S rRNA pseudouridine2605 synthase